MNFLVSFQLKHLFYWVLIFLKLFHLFLLFFLSFFLWTLDLVCSSFFILFFFFLSCYIRFFILDLSSSLIETFIAINFPPRTVLLHPICLRCVFSFSFVLRYIFKISILIYSLTHWFSGTCWLISTFLWIFQDFYCGCYLRILWSKDNWYHFNPHIFAKACFLAKLPILDSIPCALERNVYSVVVGWDVLYMSVRSYSSKV